MRAWEKVLADQKAWDVKVAKLRTAADSGDHNAELELGRLYEEGNGGHKDLDAAIMWLTRAANGGLPAACFRLGLLYDQGEAVPRNDKEAVGWYRKAAEGGHCVGQFNLALLYLKGRGVPKNEVLGYAWMNICSTAQNYPEIAKRAREVRDDLSARMTPEQVAEAQEQSTQLKKPPKDDIERLTADPNSAQTSRGRELEGRAPAALEGGLSVGTVKPPADWTCEVLDTAPGAKTGYPKKVKDSKTGIAFLLVEPGEFRMGSTEGANGAQPVHTVRITKPFYLAETETTLAQWQTVMGTNPSRFKGARRPVEQVSWDDAWEFLRKLNGGGDGPFRLPTEAEWEYACRAGTTTEYAFGENITTSQARYHSRETIDVGSLNKPNAWGFHDMHGNVHEWCQDWYEAGYYATCRDGVEDPQGPGRGSSRVMRGGSWHDVSDLLRSADRARGPDFRYDALGFRAVRTL